MSRYGVNEAFPEVGEVLNHLVRAGSIVGEAGVLVWVLASFCWLGLGLNVEGLELGRIRRGL